MIFNFMKLKNMFVNIVIICVNAALVQPTFVQGVMKNKIENWLTMNVYLKLDFLKQMEKKHAFHVIKRVENVSDKKMMNVYNVMLINLEH